MVRCPTVATWFKFRLGAGAEALDPASFDEIARRHGMSSSQWVRSLIVRELQLHGQQPERPKNDELRAYAEARSDEAIFAAHLQFEQEHPSPRDAHLRPRAPKRPSVMRVRVSVSAEEAIALEDVGRDYDMSIQQVATIVVRRWIGLNKKPPAKLFGALTGIRAEIRRIGVNVNQIAHAANRLLADARFRRQDELTDQLAEVKALQASLAAAMAAINDSMGLDRAFWGPKDARQDDRFELLPHPSIEPEYADPDPP